MMISNQKNKTISLSTIPINYNTDEYNTETAIEKTQSANHRNIFPIIRCIQIKYSYYHNSCFTRAIYVLEMRWVQSKFKKWHVFSFYFSLYASAQFF